MNVKDKTILDVTCGGRTMWFQKNHPKAIYCDKRKEEWGGRVWNNAEEKTPGD